MRRLSVLSLLVVLAVVVSAASRPVPQELSAEDVAAIRAVIDGVGKAFIAGDIEAILDQRTDQTVEVFPNEIANVGKVNVRKRFQEFMPNYDYTMWDFGITSVAGYGRIATACGHGTSEYHYGGAEELTKSESESAMILKKQDDGTWKIAVNHWVFY